MSGVEPHVDVLPLECSGQAELSTLLIDWQRRHGRHHLPWQATRDPYRVWLSEVMLQQTQVSTVLGYYARFVDRFPDVHALAAAPLDDVLGLWSGLGYYSRARNLHHCAQQVVQRYGGVFPPTSAALVELPGIGPSTAAAIAAFCHGERISILDGNVKRVLSRVLGFSADLAELRHERQLHRLAQDLLPAASAAMPAYTQGLMDLGATVCLPRQPACARCPWAGRCVAQAQGHPQHYPVRSRKLKRRSQEDWCLWLVDPGRDAVWLQQRPTRGIWAGLWCWPLFGDEGACRAVAARLSDAAQLEARAGFLHVLTHRDWTLHPRRLVLSGALSDDALAAELGPGRWWARPDWSGLGLPAPVRRELERESLDGDRQVQLPMI